MIEVNSNSSSLLFNTARIVAQHADGTESIGTAFFFQFSVDTQTFVPVIITNKHVVEGADRGLFFVHEAIKDENGKVRPSKQSFGISVPNFEASWTGHPEEEVDLCAMPFGPVLDRALSIDKEVFYISFDESVIPTQTQLGSLTALEDITMVGYPIGLWDNVNNFPILRRGVTASHPATNFQGKSLGVVDIAVFPGSSGSPVILLNEGSFSRGNGNIAIGSRFLLLGVLFAGPQYRADGSINIVDIPTKQVATASTMIPIHLGFYIKSAEIIKLKEHLFSMLNIKAA
jgi:V8-like Glu-specific endopeptidase